MPEPPYQIFLGQGNCILIFLKFQPSQRSWEGSQSYNLRHISIFLVNEGMGPCPSSFDFASLVVLERRMGHV